MLEIEGRGREATAQSAGQRGGVWCLEWQQGKATYVETIVCDLCVLLRGWGRWVDSAAVCPEGRTFAGRLG